MSPVEAVALTRELAARTAGDLAALDRSIVEEIGPPYATEVWDEDAFLLELPRKWDLSVVALEAGDAGSAGYWIASERLPGCAYAHRVAVHPELRGRGIGRLLFGRGLDLALGAGMERQALNVRPGNAGAVSFYERLGFRRADAETVAQLEAGKLPSGDRGVVLVRPVHERSSG
jgi:ribosomal protein S18 acetylase RimI-like enzyme